MFEARVLNLLRTYLGQYVRGLSEEALKISVWKGDVVLNNLQLKAEALNGLQLPITVKAGFLGSVRLKVPWNRLGKDPVIVLIDRIFILAEPVSEELILKGDDETVESRAEAKRATIEELEVRALAAKEGKKAPANTKAEDNSWLGSLIATVVGNLKISITNVHIRYEDTESHTGHPFSIGVTLAELAAFTIDDEGKETFVTSGALDRLRKALQLDRLSVYHDSDCELWRIEKSWDDLTPSEWSEMFEPGIKGEEGSPDKENQPEHYLLHPVGGAMRYLRQGKNDKREPDVPYQKGALLLREVALSLSERQYVDMMRLLDLIATIKTKQELVHLHPRVQVKGHAAEWWQYAFRGVSHQQQALRQKMSWSEIQRLSTLRKKYMDAYTEALLALPPDKQTADIPVIREYDAQLNTDLIVLWRLLAHSVADERRPKGEGAKQGHRQSGWFGYFWGGSGTAQSKSAKSEEGLSKEEWDKIDELVNYEPGADSPLAPAQEGQEAPNMLQLAVDVTVERTALKVVGADAEGVMAGAFMGVQAGMKMYPKMIAVDMRVASYGLTAPEGTLIESVGREGKDGVMKAAYVQSPLDRPNLDWLLSASMTPCHITVWRASVDRLMQFVKSGQAVNPGLALETAAVLQSKLEDVRKQAGEQLQAALQTQKKFAVNLDVDAPKIKIPVELTKEGGAKGTQLLLDLGHFTLDTDEDPPPGSDDEKEAALYTRFKVRGTDISAFLADGAFEWSAGPPLHHIKAPACGTGGDEGEYTSEQPATFILPVLDRCRISAVLQQLAVTHPSYPVTRIAVWLPQIGFHMSPSRYHRLMSIVTAVTTSTLAESQQEDEQHKPWQPADHWGPVWDLTWGGMGSTLAEWQPRWAALVGAYLYVLDSESSPTYRTYTSLVAKTVVQVPAEKIGDTPHVLAICNRGMDVNKVVMPGQAQLLRFPSEEAKESWFDALTRAIYKASGRAPLALASNDSESGELGPSDRHEQQPEQQESLEEGPQQLVYILGVLDQLMVSINGVKAGSDDDGEEVRILEMRASGGKVEMLQRTNDLSIGLGIHALELEDLFQGRVDPSCRFMARSLITASTDEDSTSRGNKSRMQEQEVSRTATQPGATSEDVEGGETYKDATEDFTAVASSPMPGPKPSEEEGGALRRGGGWESGMYFEVEDKVNEGEEGMPEKITPSFSRGANLLPGKDGEGKVGPMVASVESQVVDFVKLQLVTREPTSPDYDGVDTQMMVAMATLEFFCNRPTVAALAELGVQLSKTEGSQEASTASDGLDQDRQGSAEGNEGKGEGRQEEDEKQEASAAGADDVDLQQEEVKGLEKELEPKVVKGLLGKGQARVLFRVHMNLERARFFLNLEDGSRLAMLEQERMSVDLKMYPSSMSAAATLGNLRFCDMRLGPEHQWGWLCDLRDANSPSLIQVEFQSHDQDEEGYEGYEYSLKGQLSAVRIVFLYRFVQELLAYVTALSTPSTNQMAAVVDAKGGIERALTVSDMAGQPAVKLAIEMDAPVLVIPRTSNSSDFIQVHLGHLQVSNKSEWRGGEKEDPSVVHVDTITAESRDVSVNVGVDGEVGDPLVQELGAITVELQRPLRDLDKLLPVAQLHVQIGKIRAAMSDREYRIITECATANMAEPANLPPDFRKTIGAETEWAALAPAGALLPEAPDDETTKAEEISSISTEKQGAAKQGEVPAPGTDAQAVYTTVRVSIHMQLAQLELFTGSARDTPLSLFEVQGMWVEYRANSVEESEVLLSVLKMSVLDQRLHTRPEMRLVMGSALDVDPSAGSTQRVDQSATLEDQTGSAGEAALTMVVLNFVMKPTSIVLDVRLQRPRLLVALDFVLPLGEFFIPSLGAMAGKDDEKDERDDPLGLQNHIRLTEAQHFQSEVDVFLSPDRQLVADGAGCDEFVYDGCGHNLWLLEEDGVGIPGSRSGPLVRVGDAKHLRFQNVTIQNGERLDDSVELGSNSSYRASQADGVRLVSSSDAPKSRGTRGGAEETRAGKDSAQAVAASNVAVNVQAVAPELTFYDSTKWAPGTSLRPEKLLRMKLDLNVLLAMKGNDMYVLASLRAFMAETASALTIVEPLDVVADFQLVAGKTTLNLTTTDLALRLPLNVLRLLLRLQTDVTAALRMGGGPPVARCTTFDLIWHSPTGDQRTHQIAIWRPRAPSGYVTAGDCLTSGREPPSQGVLVVSTGFRRVRKPRGYEVVWASGDHEDACRLWLPQAPPGYVALGCIARCGKEPPPRSAVHCIRADLLTSSSISDCPYYVLDAPPNCGRGTMWRLDNSVGTFVARGDESEPPKDCAWDLRRELQFSIVDQAGDAATSTPGPSTTAKPSSTSVEARGGATRLEPDSAQSSTLQETTKHYTTTPDLERVWWSKDGDVRRHVAIWRPVPPQGYVIFGDVAVEGFEHPDWGLVVLDDLESGRLSKPTGYVESARIKGQGWQDASIWFPVAPPGYVALGCIVTPSHDQPPIGLVRCIRMDLVSQKSFASKPVWSFSASPRGQSALTLWTVENQAQTFMAASGYKKPQWRLAFSLAELEKPAAPANISASIKVARVSATVFDDFSGELVPLLDASVSDIQLAIHGRTEALSAVVFTSMAASTYSPNLGVWEPLIEPFDGIFKYESKTEGMDAGTHVRITTTSAVQMNLSAAGLDIFMGTYFAWNQAAADEQASKDALHKRLLDEGGGETSLSALDQEEGSRLQLNNKLGQPLYAKTSQEQNLHVVGAGKIQPIPLQRQRISDLNRPLSRDMPQRQPRHFMAIRILKAQDLASGDGIAGKEFVCYLRVATTGGPADSQNKLMPQSARSRGVPMTPASEGDDSREAAKWDECFVFEIPAQEGAQLELVVTNQAANAGRGAGVGAAVIPMDPARSSARESHWNTVKAALSIGTSSWSSVGEQCLQLRPMPSQGEDLEESSVCGTIIVKDFFYVLGRSEHVQTAQAIIQDEESRNFDDAVMQVASAPDGPWTPLRPMATVTTVAQMIGGRNLALEASVQNGYKCFTFRSLATFVNSTESTIEVAVAPRLLINEAEGVQAGEEAKPEVEIYENQRFQPLTGWGSSWPTHLLASDPAHYTSENFDNPFQELPEEPAPGWEWASGWYVDVGSSSDPEGWVYGRDFKSLAQGSTRSTAPGSKGPMDSVRRRRLVRVRRPLASTHSLDTSSSSPRERQVVGVCKPGGTVVLPWASLAPGSDLCLQVRPVEEDSSAPAYAWSKVAPRSSSNGSLPPQGEGSNGAGVGMGATTREALMFQLGELSPSKEASKHEELFMCEGPKGPWWLSLDADSERLHGEGPHTAYDWKLTARPPLKLENRLPCSAEYVIFEKTKTGGHSSRSHAVQRGVVNAGGEVQVHSVDIRCPVLSTFLPQGGWKLEKEATLISDPLASELPGTFSLTNSYSNRTLRINIDNDMGGTEVSAKLVRYFAPYWLQNDGLLPLHYRLVETEPPTGTLQGTDSLWLAHATTGAKASGQVEAKGKTSGGGAGSSKAISTVAVIEEVDSTRPVMLSLPKDSENLGLSIALSPAGSFSHGIAFQALESKAERLELKAMDADGTYFRLALLLDLSSFGYERTKVVRVQPFVAYTNQLGYSIKLRQSGCAPEHTLAPEARGECLRWHSAWEPELLQVGLEGHQWSRAFSVDMEGTMHIILRGLDGQVRTVLRAEVCNGVPASRLHVLFRRASTQGPYKIENRSILLPVRFRQVGSSDEAWQLLQAGSSSAFAWEDLRHERKIEIMVEGADPTTAREFHIDDEAEFEPTTSEKGPVAALSVKVSREVSGVMRVKISDWKPSDAYPEDWSLVTSPFDPAAASGRPTTPTAAASGTETALGGDDAGGSMFSIQLHLDEFGLSLIDQTPEELIYMSMHSTHISYDTSPAVGASRIKLQVGHVQLDNQLAQTAMPVLLAPQEAADAQQEHVLKLSVTSQAMRLTDEEWYRYISLQLPSEAWLVNLHEPIVWRLYAMLSKLDLGRLSTSTEESTSVAVDPRVRITLFHMLDARIKVTLAMAPTQRPRGILGVWSTLISSLGNTDEMPIHISEKVCENVYMRKSQLQTVATQSIINDLLSQPLQLLSGLDVLGNTSSALGHMSKGVAALSMDPIFIRARQHQETKTSVEGLGDGLREGGEALAKGLFRGVTGVLTKPVEGTRDGGGVEGFLSGVGKGIVGAAAQPVSGVLDLVSKTTEGANVARVKSSPAISLLKRRRLPRAIRGDNTLQPYDEYSARGQAILQLAERGALFGSATLDVKERGKFAMTDAYEDHHNLPKQQTLMITHRRIMLLQHPAAMPGQQVDLLRDPCTILWDIPWPELLAIELRRLEGEPPASPPSLLVLHLREWSPQSRFGEAREIARTVECHPGSEQALEVRESLEKARSKYGPDNATVAAQTKVRRAESRPYVGAASGAASGAALGLLAGPAAPAAIPLMATVGAFAGGAGQVLLEEDGKEISSGRRQEGPGAGRAATAATASVGASQPAHQRDEPLARAGKLTSQFGLIWSDKGKIRSSGNHLAIWRPVCPPGHVSVGDIITAGYEPPAKATVYRDDRNNKFVAPDGFDLAWRDTSSTTKVPVTIWTPRPPSGYVSVGCVAVADHYEPDRSTVRCVRRDCVVATQLSRQPIWQEKGSTLWRCSLWQVVNEAHTFVALQEQDSPETTVAFTVSI